MSTSLVITAVSVAFAAVIVLVVLRSAGILGPRKKVLASGMPGRATILGVAPTGTIINNVKYVCAFQLRVELPGAAPYAVVAKDSVLITEMGSIVPGMVVAVRVAADDQSKVFIDWQATPVGGGAPVSQAGPVSAQAIATALQDPSTIAAVPRGSAADLLRTGQPAQGYLRSFSDTGTTPRSLGHAVAPQNMDDPLYVLQVELHMAPGMTPIEGTVVHRVPRAIAPTLRVGMPLRCAVNPGNPTREFAVAWDGVPAAADNGSWV